MLKYIFLFVWISVLFPNVTSEPQVHVDLIVNKSLHPGGYSCPREKIKFTCTVNGSRVLIWSSTEYIGSGGAQLKFSNSDEIGYTRNSIVDSGTFAILKNVNNGTGSDSDTIQLQSELYISMCNQSSRVFCFSGSDATARKNAFFLVVLGQPHTPQNAAATEFPSNRLGTCVLLIDWDPPDLIDNFSIKQYIIRTSRESEIPQTNATRTLATIESPCNEIANVTINITAVDVCGQESEPTANFVPTLVVTPSMATTTQTPKRFGIAIIYYAMIVVAVSGVISLLILFCLFVLVVCICCKKTSEQSVPLHTDGSLSNNGYGSTSSTIAAAHTQKDGTFLS